MKRITHNNFFKSITALASGSIIAQLITMIASPMMTRLYTTEEIGLYSLILTMVNMFGLILSGRYEMSIVSENDETNIFPLIKLSGYITILSSLVISIVFFFININKVLSGDYKFILISLYILIVLLSTGLVNIINAYNNRKKEYLLMTHVHVIRTFGKDVSMIMFGVLSFGNFGLLLSELIGKLLGLKKQLKSLMPYFKCIISIKNDEVKRVAKFHYRQPVFSMPAIFANSFSYSAVNLFIEKLYGLTSLGYYSISYRVLGIPLTIVSHNVSKVYFEEASREFARNNNYKRTFLKTTAFLSVIALPMVVFMIFFAPTIFEWFFGEGWSSAGNYVRILAPMFGIRLVVSPLSTGMIISNKQNKELVIQIIFAITSIFLFIFSLLYKVKIQNYLFLLTITNSLIYISYYCVLFRNAKNTN